MKKIKKYFPLITGLVILLSVAAYGTRAYFTDSAEEQVGINLTLGTVSVSSQSEEWQYVPNNGVNSDIEGISESEPSKDGTIEYARPGDAFTKVFTFTNKGTLEQILTFDSNGNDSVGAFDVSWEGSIFDENNSIILPKNHGTEVTMKISVPLNGNEAVAFSKEGANSNNKVKNINQFIGSSVKVQAEQTNAK